jgi:hypothetical protein
MEVLEGEGLGFCIDGAYSGKVRNDVLSHIFMTVSASLYSLVDLSLPLLWVCVPKPQLARHDPTVVLSDRWAARLC